MVWLGSRGPVSNFLNSVTKHLLSRLPLTSSKGRAKVWPECPSPRKGRRQKLEEVRLPSCTQAENAGPREPGTLQHSYCAEVCAATGTCAGLCLSHTYSVSSLWALNANSAGCFLTQPASPLPSSPPPRLREVRVEHRACCFPAPHPDQLQSFCSYTGTLGLPVT